MSKIKKAVNWFKDSIKRLKNNKKVPDDMIDVSKSKTPPIGEVVLFTYDPKHKKTLPYYDTNPLVLLTGINGNTDFFGINLHYIPPDIRKKILFAMYKSKEKHQNNKKAYIADVMPMLDAYGNSDLFSHTYKHYKTNHVRSNMAIVKHKNWKVVGMLPLQKFEKATAKEVWKDAKRIKSKRAREFGF